jgi:hypothetical protein
MQKFVFSAEPHRAPTPHSSLEPSDCRAQKGPPKRAGIRLKRGMLHIVKDGMQQVANVYKAKKNPAVAG